MGKLDTTMEFEDLILKYSLKTSHMFLNVFFHCIAESLSFSFSNSLSLVLLPNKKTMS